MPELPPLTLGDEREAVLDHAGELIHDAWTSFDAARPSQPGISAATQADISAPLPETGEDPRAVLDAAARILDESVTNSRPRFLAFIPSSGLEIAALADALAATHDVNLASEAAAANLVERQTLQWVGDFVGFPADGGSFTSGGMVSNLTALATARERACPGAREHGSPADGVVYASAEAHSSIERAVDLIGIGSANLRDVPIDEERRMRPDALRELLTRDVADGRLPLCVVATAGTTLTGTVDPIGAIADVCAEFGVWLHVDGAYGLPAAAAPSTRHLFAGLERADSVAVDAHKWLFVPKACGVVLVRDRSALTAAFAHDAAYMADDEAAHPVDWTLEYSRPFRALKLWVALRTHGAERFREAIEHDLELARLLADRVRATPGLELLHQPDLTVVPFRRVPAQGDADEHNQELARRIQRDARAYLASAVIDGRAWLRPCITNFRTTAADIDALVEIVLDLGAQLDAERDGHSG